MQQQLHTTTVHPKPVTEPVEVVVGSHHTNYFVTSSLSRSHSLISKLVIILLFPLWGLGSYAQQPYEWQWAMNGGASKGGTGTITPDYEQIYDIKVGTDGNYYFIGTLKGPFNANLNGEEVPSYNFANVVSGGNNDILLFSTDCEGQIRWSQTIGGWRDDNAYNLVLDGDNNVYVGANINNSSAGSGPGIRRPVHFTENDSIAFPDTSNGGAQIGYKSTYLLKYNSNGDLENRVALQGPVSSSNWQSRISDLAISNDTLHFMVFLDSGTHLDGNVTVANGYKFFIAKYDLNLDYVNSFELPLEDNTGFNLYGQTKFAYDASKHQYYIAGIRGETGTLQPLKYDGGAFVERSFILAINDSDGSEIWRREIYSDPGASSVPSGNIITSLAIDDDSNVYIGGCRFRHPTYLDLKIYDPTDSSVQPYIITTGADFTVPMIVKFNSDGDVQWVQATSSHDSTISASANRRGKGIAINGSEVAFGAQGGADSWGTINIARPLGANFQPDPILVRFNKQSGNVLGANDIEGEPVSGKRMTAVVADNDGNYIVGGSFDANLFMNNNLGISPLYTTGEADFFVAKLANSECGTGASTEEFNGLKINVYPNPTTDKVYFETEEKLTTYSVFNENAQQIKVQTQINETNYQMNFGGLPTGVYFVIIRTESGKSTTVKIIKE